MEMIRDNPGRMTGVFDRYNSTQQVRRGVMLRLGGFSELCRNGSAVGDGVAAAQQSRASPNSRPAAAHAAAAATARSPKQSKS